MKIKMLCPETINKIAAGEVIVRPVSVIKELVENSIDAGASQVTVFLEAGGKNMITVRDNGCGIAYNEVPLAFKRHATSKISTIEDLESISSLGFRGEALSSVAAVAKVTITTRNSDEEIGSISEFQDGVLLDQRVCAYTQGTEIRIEDLFYNTPARRKHLGKDQKEEMLIRDLIQKLALSHPQMDFQLISRGKTIVDTTGANELVQVIDLLYGKNLSTNLILLKHENRPMILKGAIGNLQTMRSTREDQIFFINNRYVKSRALSEAFEEAYSGYLMKHQHPFGIIFLDLPSRMLDVNIHPAKTEIKILNESLIKILFKQGIRDNLKKSNLVVDLEKLEVNEKKEMKALRQDKVKDEVAEAVQDNFFNAREEDFDKQQETDSAIHTVNDQTSTKKIENDPLKENFKRSSQKPQLAEKNKSGSETKQLKESKADFSRASEKQMAGKIDEERVMVEKTRMPRPDFMKMKQIGQLFDVYIILESGQEIYLIDQHAAHEAFLTHELTRIFLSAQGIPSQGLMMPLPLKFRPKDRISIENHFDLFARIGYECETFGEDCLLVRSVPILLGEVQGLAFLENFIEEYAGSDFYKWDNDNPMTQSVKSKLISMACKAAIKGGQSLSDNEIRALLERLMELDNPFTCPHGRPIILKMNEYELKKLFKRVV